jgi:hypothetical protein
MAYVRLGKHLGSGGFGVVREASRIDDEGQVVGDSVAVKLLGDEHIDDADALARFVREVRLQERELEHPNIIEVIESHLEERPPYFLMPLAETTLQKEIDAGKAGDRAWVIHVFGQVLAGMAHAHDREIPVLHRDLKPLNILFVRGVAKVADFGLGKRLDPNLTTLTKTWAAMGTEPYMSPEQFNDAKRVGPPSDVYALGKVLWHMLTGEVPAILWVDVGAVSRDFRFFIEKCCRRDPEERYRNAADALAAFELFTTTPGVLDPPMEGTEKLVAAWTAADTDTERLGVVRRLDEHLQRNRDERELFQKVIPRLPEELVDLYMTELDDAFMETLLVYDNHVSGNLPFAYCDVVANFYRRLWRRRDDLILRRRLLARLIELGATHNRWYLGQIVADLLAGIDDVGTAMMAAEVIDADARHAEWYWDPWVKRLPLLQPVADAFARVLIDAA